MWHASCTLLGSFPSRTQNFSLSHAHVVVEEFIKTDLPSLFFTSNLMMSTLLILAVCRTSGQPSKWPSSPQVSQFVKAPNRYLVGHGFDSRRELVPCSCHCWKIPFNYLSPSLKFTIFIIYLTLWLFTNMQRLFTLDRGFATLSTIAASPLFVTAKKKNPLEPRVAFVVHVGDYVPCQHKCVFFDAFLVDAFPCS